MRKIALVLGAALLLSACGIIGGTSKEDEAKAFCTRATTANEAGVLDSIDGTETAAELKAYEATQESVDYLGDHFPAKIEQPTKDFVAAYDELVTELTAAGFDASAIDATTLSGINERLDAALVDMAAVLENQCDVTVGG